VRALRVMWLELFGAETLSESPGREGWVGGCVVGVCDKAGVGFAVLWLGAC